MIELGLARISRLLRHTPQPWEAIHVAGTNGKGSVCAYVSALLHAQGVSCGRFTSPHLVDRWDCIAVDEQPVTEAAFRDAERLVRRRDRDESIGATEFELLTATAFEIFTRARVRFGVVEAGLGGRLDATNALLAARKRVAVFAKVGLDHQAFLGDTLEAIAREKAGIMQPGVRRVVVDPSNDPAVHRVLEAHARDVGIDVDRDYHRAVPTAGLAAAMAAEGGLEPHQVHNLAVAELAVAQAYDDPDAVDLMPLLPAVRRVQWPGRLQRLDISRAVPARREDVLLDGAHNPQSAEVLASYVQKHLRTTPDGNEMPVTWVVAATQGKDMHGIFELLLRPGDRIAAVRFDPVDGMPWVQPADPAELLRLAAELGVEGETAQHNGGNNLQGTLEWATAEAAGRPLVIAGSLYLVSSVLRLLRRRAGSDGEGKSG